MLRKKNHKGQSILEYIILATILLAGYLLFQKYLAHGIFGRWKSAGDALSGDAGLYDVNKTLECGYDYLVTKNWYNTACYEKDDCASLYPGYEVTNPDVSAYNKCVTTCHAVQCDD
ncbi:MAG: hypothetical protein HQL24_09665 [Candidatus Omnitrophica bacterium]|nr:hypothetical protein [Candidatus Omnitrophota bacterium]